ncbi:MAG: hypothetical protein HQL86_01845 [Magnetococcales bacterium]|nr:hypothetical protein [Magnetococcales bacterium]
MMPWSDSFSGPFKIGSMRLSCQVFKSFTASWSHFRANKRVALTGCVHPAKTNLIHVSHP